MPKERYQKRELTHNWEDIRPLLKDSAQITYEIIRPVVLFGVSPKERKSTIYAKANLFDASGMASLLFLLPTFQSRTSVPFLHPYVRQLSMPMPSMQS